MKALFFYAAVPHPKVLGAVEAQTRNTMRPFQRFIAQAIHTAKDRQFRYQLPWERVRDLRTLSLMPLDTIIRIPKRERGHVITNWPNGQPPDTSQHGFVTNRGVPVRILEAQQIEHGLRVRIDSPIRSEDKLLWCSVACDLVAEAEPPPPQTLCTASGDPLHVTVPPAANEDDKYWRLVVEGIHQDAELICDGISVFAQVIPAREGLARLIDADGRTFEPKDGLLRSEELPAQGPLRGNDGIRYEWTADGGGTGRRGHWIQLLLPDAPEKIDTEEFIDPRAAFCEGEVDEVWTSKTRRDADIYKVKKVDQDRYQLLLDELPPERSTLFLPIDLRSLYLQQRALRQLAEAPLPHHQGLLRLCEDPQHARWPAVLPQTVTTWYSLTDETRSGTNEQRRFVEKALGVPDLGILEGPPGSGKTTAICEIVQQLVLQGKRVLLCASTHVAIDNVLERLIESSVPIDAVRIGKLDKVDDRVQRVWLDAKIEKLVSAWRGQKDMQAYGSHELTEMAERMIIMAANLTCGTMMGIVNHPLFRGRDGDLHISERPITTLPHWDVLIVDEASKTLIQEFMVPALMAQKWIIVGDVHQLPPFADQADIVANLRDLVDEKNQPLFPRDHQRACLLRYRLQRRALRQQKLRFLIVEPPGVLRSLAQELRASPIPDLSVVRIVSHQSHAGALVPEVTTSQIQSGHPASLLLAACDWVLCDSDLAAEVGRFIPSNLIVVGSGSAGGLPDNHPFLLRQAHWRQHAKPLLYPYKERNFSQTDISSVTACQQCETDWLSRHDLAQEIAWRLTRIHELRHSRNDLDRGRLRADIERLKPVAKNISEPLAEIEDIGLPSILEVLQEGIGAERSKRPSALTEGLRAGAAAVFSSRFESLSYQHRMHPQISEFPREMIYHGSSLRDANTIESRDKKLGWDFGRFGSRRVWADYKGRESQGENQDEVQIIAGLLLEFIAWAKRKGPPNRSGPKLWEVACLCFYVKQERAISRKLKEITKDDRKTRFVVPDAPVEIVCGTVDRFQGREADFVMLSMRNTKRVGFLNSPNRLNVAVTRARQQLVVIGNADYFRQCEIAELQELATRTQLIGEQMVRRFVKGMR